MGIGRRSQQSVDLRGGTAKSCKKARKARFAGECGWIRTAISATHRPGSMESSALLLGDSLSEWSHADHTSGMPHASSRTASSGTSTTPSVTTASTEWVASSAESDPEGSNALAPRHDRTIAQIGWAMLIEKKIGVRRSPVPPSHSRKIGVR